MSESIPGRGFLRGGPGDARRGTVYGHRTAAEYNRIKVAEAERQEGRPVKLLHFARKLKNDNYICEFVVIGGPIDPGMKVYSRAPGTDPATQPLAFTGDPAKGTCRPFTLLDAILNGYQGEFLPFADPVVEEWPRTEEDGRYVFHAPPGYKGGPIVWLHDKGLLDESLVYESTMVFSEVGAPAAELLSNDGPVTDVGMSEVQAKNVSVVKVQTARQEQA